MDARVIEGGISIILKEKLFFKTGMSEIEEKNYPALKNLSSILQKTDCQIRVEGHTDDIPIENKRFSSNWELSVARAVNVVKYLISKGNISPARLSASGYGDSRPLYPNVSDHNRELNRRVGIILTISEN
jgi:chemotaxis protein MotB